MKKSSLIGVLCAVVIGIAADLPAQATKIKVGYSTIGFGQSLIWITKEANIFAENGLDLELLYIVSSATATQSLLARDIPIVNMSGIAAISANLAGQDLVMVASPRNDPAQSFLVAAKDIKEFSQLKGKKLGVSRFGSSSDFLLRYILKKIGLVPERDVSIVQVGSAPVRMAALANGAIDGTALTVEEVLVARKLGFTVLADISQLGIESLNSDVVTTRGFIRDSRDTVRRFVKAMAAGASFYKKNKPFVIKVISKYTKTSDKEKLDAGYDFHAKSFLPKPYPSVKGTQLALEQLGEKNPASQKAKPEQFMDSSFVKELDESGYLDSLYK